MRGKVWGGGGEEAKEICSVLILVPVSLAARPRLQPASSCTCCKQTDGAAGAGRGGKRKKVSLTLPSYQQGGMGRNSRGTEMCEVGSKGPCVPTRRRKKLHLMGLSGRHTAESEGLHVDSLTYSSRQPWGMCCS